MKYTIEIHKSLSSKLMTDWEKIWLSSANAHIFNSPYWYKSCLQANPYSEMLILVCRSSSANREIYGVLPLILGRKFGSNVYMSPGRKYLDKSTLFITEDKENVLTEIIYTLKTCGNFYLTEVNVEVMSTLKKMHMEVGFDQSSISRILPFETNPYRFYRRHNLKRLRISLTQYGKNLSVKKCVNNISGIVKILSEIENKSSKLSSHKAIFADSYFLKLLECIDNNYPDAIQTYILYYDNKPVCFKFGFKIARTFHSCNTAFDESFRWLRPGKLITLKIIDELVKDGIHTLDFSRGDNAFKSDFTDLTYNQYSIYYLKNSLSMFLWNLVYRVKRITLKQDRIIEEIRIKLDTAISYLIRLKRNHAKSNN